MPSYSNDGEKRSEERMSVDRRATARFALSLELRDISAHGLRVRCDLRLPVGTVIRFALPGAVQTHARVAWSDDEHIGCDLLRALTPSELTIITAADPSLIAAQIA